MKLFAVALILIITATSAVATSITDSLGVVRVFGDQTSTMSAAFVVGDGSWVVTPLDAVVEKVGPKTEQAIHYPVYISQYTGQAWQCELKAQNKDLALALLKLPVSGLPAAPLSKISEYKYASLGTLGQLMSGEPIGNLWPTDIYGITRQKSGSTYKLALEQWNGKKMFVTDIGDYKWAFASDVSPDTAIPNGSLVARGTNGVGMYMNKMTITGGKENVVFGRVLMSSEMAKFLGDHGVDTDKLYDPPAPTIVRDEYASASFQLLTRLYSLLGARKPAQGVDAAAELVKMRPKDALAQMLMGMTLTASGKFEESLKAYDEAMKLDAKLPTLRTNRALALIGLKKNDEAEAELLKSVEENPTDARPVTALADFYMADDKTLDKAVTYAQKAARMASGSPAAELLLARAHKQKKDYKAATTAIGEALKISPDWYDAWFALGVTCEEAGDKPSAEKAYRRLVTKQPTNSDALLTLASFLADQGQKDEPLELIGKVRELKPPKEVLDAAQTLEDKINGKKP